MRGDFLLSWVFLGSLLALLINDFILKPNHPGVLSGILSDLAGMIFFPVFFVAISEFAAALLPDRPLASPRWFWISTGLVAFLLVFVKFTEVGQGLYSALVTPILNSPLAALTVGAPGAVSDPWDLLALLLVPIPVLVGYRYRGKAAPPPRLRAALTNSR